MQAEHAPPASACPGLPGTHPAQFSLPVAALRPLLCSQLSCRSTSPIRTSVAVAFPLAQEWESSLCYYSLCARCTDACHPLHLSYGGKSSPSAFGGRAAALGLKTISLQALMQRVSFSAAAPGALQFSPGSPVAHQPQSVCPHLPPCSAVLRLRALLLGSRHRIITPH